MDGTFWWQYRYRGSRKSNVICLRILPFLLIIMPFPLYLLMPSEPIFGFPMWIEKEYLSRNPLGLRYEVGTAQGAADHELSSYQFLNLSWRQTATVWLPSLYCVINVRNHPWKYISNICSVHPEQQFSTCGLGHLWQTSLQQYLHYES